MNIVFFGTPDFAVGTLSHLIESGFIPKAIVTRPDKPKGRSGKPTPSPVKAFALKNLPDVPIFQPEKASSPSFIETLSKFDPDLFVVVAYGEIISDQLLHLPKIACINVHASLLPELRGAAPIHRAIIGGKTESGVTIMHMVKKMDAGDMIRSAKVPIGPEMTVGELHDELMEVGARELIFALDHLDTRIPQDGSKVTYAPKIELEDCEIQWDRPAQEIHNLIRGSNPFPGAWCWATIDGEKKRFKILLTQIVEGTGKPGTLLFLDQKMVVACGTGALELKLIKPEGKKGMVASDFLRGHQDVIF